jgi:hypothetical protein
MVYSSIYEQRRSQIKQAGRQTRAYFMCGPFKWEWHEANAITPHISTKEFSTIILETFIQLFVVQLYFMRRLFSLYYVYDNIF